MKKKLLCIFILLIGILSVDLVKAQIAIFPQRSVMPTDGDYSKWNWEYLEKDNWKRKRGNNWEHISPPFAANTDKMNLLYKIYKDMDYTNNRGWRLVHANFDGTFPYFILYNIYNGLLRGFLYVEGDGAVPYGSTVGMTLTPDINTKNTKLLHLSEKILYGIKDSGPESMFSKTSVTSFTAAGLNSWAAFEIPMLFDFTVANSELEWDIEFFSGTSSDVKFVINGTSVPMDSNGNNLFSHPKIQSQGNLKADYAQIHSMIKDMADWGNKLESHASKLDTMPEKTPQFLKEYKKKVAGLGKVIKVAGTISQISSGIEVALGIFDFFFGGSSSSLPVGYSHTFTGSGTITTLNRIRGNTMSVPGSKNTRIPSWSFDCQMGVMNLLNTPSIYKTTPYLKPTFDGYDESTKTGWKYMDLYYAPSQVRLQRYYNGIISYEYPIYCNYYPIVKYHFSNPINLRYNDVIEIIDTKFAIICKDNNLEHITKPLFFGDQLGAGYYGYYLNLKNPVYDQLSSGKLKLYEFNQEQNIYIYGTPYVSYQNLIKNHHSFETFQGTEVLLSVIVSYKEKLSLGSEIKYFKGTYKLNEMESQAPKRVVFNGQAQPRPGSSFNHLLWTLGHNYDCNDTGWRSPQFSGIISVYSSNLESETIKDYEVSFSPNPSSGLITFHNDGYADASTIQISNSSNRVVYFKQNVYNGDQIDLSNQQKGIYALKIIIDGQVKNQKIIIK